MSLPGSPRKMVGGKKEASAVYREKLTNWKHGLLSNETHPDDLPMNIFMRNTQKKQSKTQAVNKYTMDETRVGWKQQRN